MKNHVWRPLLVVIGIAVLILLARFFIVPSDFGAHEAGYMYGWHRKGNEQDWKNFKVKYRGQVYCAECHEDKIARMEGTVHASIQCENCHGPAVDHPDEPPVLAIDRSREQCLRCHARLAYPTSGRAEIRGILNDRHNPGEACVSCHDPHHPNLEEM